MDKNRACIIASQYIEYLISAGFDISRAFLFGSYAKGTNHKDSDIDVAVVFNKIEDKFNLQVKLLMLTTRFDTRLEPHPFEESDFLEHFSLIEDIISNGIEILLLETTKSI